MKVSVKSQSSVEPMSANACHRAWCFINSQKKKRKSALNEQSLHRATVDTVAAGIRSHEYTVLWNISTADPVKCAYMEVLWKHFKGWYCQCIEESLWMLTLSSGVSSMVIWKQCNSNICDIWIYIKDIVPRTRLNQSTVQIKHQVLSFSSLS